MLIRNNLSNNAVTEKNILFKPGCVFFFSPFQTAKRKEEKKKEFLFVTFRPLLSLYKNAR